MTTITASAFIVEAIIVAFIVKHTNWNFIPFEILKTTYFTNSIAKVVANTSIEIMEITSIRSAFVVGLYY